MLQETAKNSIEPEGINVKADAIVLAARKLFLEQGYGAVSMDAIAAEAAVSKRTVYSHFANKEELFAGVIRGLCVVGSWDPSALPFDVEAPAELVLSEIGTMFLHTTMTSNAIALHRTVIAEAPRFPELGKVFFETGPAVLLAIVADVLRAQTLIGHLEIDDADEAAAQLLALFYNPLGLRVQLGIEANPSDERIAQVVASSVKTFIKSHAPRA